MLLCFVFALELTHFSPCCLLHDTDVLLLKITYSPTYPDELPEIGVECEEGELSEEEEEHLVMELIAAVGRCFPTQPFSII